MKQFIDICGGNSYGTSATVDQNGNIVGDITAAIQQQAKRLVAVTEWVKKGQA